ncbi:MAG TPA: MFS transporter [Pseudomonadota bacterium]|nr:MFS transporter [Pseudomonadota bacterium]
MLRQQSKWFGLPQPFWYLWTGVLINRLGGFVFTFLAIYLTQQRKFSVEEAGLVVSLYGVGSVCAGPVGGTLADRIGRKATLLIGLLGAASAMVYLGLAREYVYIAAGAVVLGFFNDLSRPASQAAIADLVPPEDRVRAFGLHYWAINLGFAGSSMLAGFLARFDFMWLFFGDAAATTLFGIIVLLRIPETRPSGEPHAGEHTPPTETQSRGPFAPYRDPIFLPLFVAQLIWAWIFMQSSSSLPLDMSQHGISMSRYGQLAAINGLLIVLLQPFVLRHITRMPRALAMSVGVLLTGVGFGICGFGSSVTIYIVSIVIWTLGEIVLSPILPTLIADLAPRSLRGTYQGGFQLAWGAALLLGPALGGLVMGRFGSRTLWLICAALGIGVAWTHLLIAPARRRRLSQLPDGNEALRREQGSP